jgi:hypothetical protein
MEGTYITLFWSCCAVKIHPSIHPLPMAWYGVRAPGRSVAVAVSRNYKELYISLLLLRVVVQSEHPILALYARHLEKKYSIITASIITQVVEVGSLVLQFMDQE